MVIIGIDPHPGSHTAAALDENGKVLGHLTVSNDKAGLKKLGSWLGSYEVETCAVEGANNPFARALSSLLLQAPYRLVDISPSLTSQYRSKRGRKKNDEVDAENIARVLLANPELVSFQLQDRVEDLKQLSRTRETLVAQLTAQRLSLKSVQLAQVRQALEAVISAVSEQIEQLELAMKSIVAELMPELLELQGVGPVHAATLLAEAGDVRRFKSQHAFAMFAGCAPVEKSSGAHKRRQLNTGGNRRLNRVFHMMIQVRLRCDEVTRAYIDKKQQEGKTLRAALRCLKTYLAREVFRFMLGNAKQHPKRWAST